VALVCLALLQGACVLDGSPSVRACRDGGYHVASDRASGGLRILPSSVAGIEVDTAAWKTFARVNGPSAETSLILTARLRADRPVDVDQLALIYRLGNGPDAAAIVDARLRRPIFTAPRASPATVAVVSWTEAGVPDDSRNVKAGRTIPTERLHTLEYGLYTGRTAPLAGCPTSVQLVRRTELALHLGSGRAWSRQRSGAAGDGSQEARVVWDTLIDFGSVSEMVVGIVANPSNDTLKRPIATLALSPPLQVPTSLDATTRLSGEPASVLEYALDTLAPGAVAGFAGGWLDYGEHVAERSVRGLAPGEEWPGAGIHPRSNHWIRRTGPASGAQP